MKYLEEKETYLKLMLWRKKGSRHFAFRNYIISEEDSKHIKKIPEAQLYMRVARLLDAAKTNRSITRT
ncbi:hypothetical protein BpHYR1_014344, partial [Brachionus plicatilis]